MRAGGGEFFFDGKNWECLGIQLFLLPGSCWVAKYIVVYRYCDHGIFSEWFSSRAVSAMYECSTIAGVETTHDPNHCLNPT